MTYLFGNRPLTLAAVLLHAAFSVQPAGAQPAGGTELFEDLLRENRYTFSLQEGQLSGPGADFLLEEGRQSHFFMIGEQHGIADVPELAAAVFHALRHDGFDHLVIEVSPPLARHLEELARGSPAAVVEIPYPLAVPFFTWHEEARLLSDVVKAGGSLWGVDYDFMFSTPLWMEILGQRARTEEARALVHDVREAAIAGETRLLEAGDPTGLFLIAADVGDFDALRRAFPDDPDAAGIIDWMEASAEPWRLWFAGEPYESNRARTDLIRRAFAEQYRAARNHVGTGPRAVLKFGANHVFRGRTPVDVFDIGTLAAMLAEYERSRAFNVMVLAGPGTMQTALQPTGMTVVPSEPPAWAEPLFHAAESDAWTAFDLRPLRPHLSQKRIQLPPDLERVVWGYDAFVVLAGSRPAGFGPLPE